MAEAVPSPRIARLAGAMYLGTIVLGLFAEVGARGSLIVGGDAAATARAILADETLFRAGIAADLAMLACYVGVTALFLDMFRPVHAGASRMAAAFSFIGIAVLAADTLLLLAPLRLLAPSPALATLGEPQREAAALLALRIHGDNYDVSLVFFGIYCLMLGCLAWRCGFLPKAIGALMALAGGCYIFDSVADLTAPTFARTLSPHLMDPTLIGEAALALWLLVFGARGTPGRATRMPQAARQGHRA
ncbi:DUF4386 domain-containing protein [Sphingomonas nostoxanthinifaciens]|uniref:DUF4386 domain-containing protein n=1 Tax=Sphingomonas nostoxanthinifaciens TaxID=2872652 RepID=UPI001CC20D80|nr:DUF4386 domain-containing protein [Sphingomonas nostoxanthinifaciens]UAK25488.1 DUF4386 domain-containing protein [Sphingomonas nostoxanthinifaciens]